MNLGQRLKHLREKSNLTLEEVGKQIGVNKATVQRYESGVLDVTRKMAIKLADILQTTPAYIMGWSEKDDLNFTDDEKCIIIKYRLLDERGKQAVNDTLLREYLYTAASGIGSVPQGREPLPYAAAGGVIDNLGEAKVLYDEAMSDIKEKK
jgi:transcriptional regulator with XRE-family HTH domain